MNFLAKIILFLAFTVPALRPVHAQFVDVMLHVEPRLEGKVEQMLSFGSPRINSGRNYINPNDVNAGLISITTLENHSLIVSLDTPRLLHHNDPSVDDAISARLTVQYGYDPEKYEHNVSVSPFPTAIEIKEDRGANPWNTLYFFIFGEITVGNIREGTYAGRMVLTIEYL